MLPKAILDMKFMKKSKEKYEKELENTRGYDDMYSHIISDKMRQATGNYIVENSFIFCDQLIQGRVSYKGMNPEIEKLMALEAGSGECDGEMGKDVSDEILAKKFQALKRAKYSFENGPTAKKRK